MKLKCPCGNVIHDGSDSLPFKGHLVPDEDFLGNFDRNDRLLDRVAKNGSVDEKDYMEVRRTSTESRHIYQCRECGRVFIWDKEIKGAFSFAPEDPDVNKALLASQRRRIDT